MVAWNLRALILVAMTATSWASPLKKRIAQTISASTEKWVQACQAAGGGDQCNPLSQTAFMTLLAAAGPCDQQNAADQMINLAKSLNNDANMIKFTQIFVQQPRNSPDSFQIPYCQQAPKNSELNGLFQCQFEGTKDTFVGNLQAGAEGTVPFGLSRLDTPRSCPANTQGGIADGSQLVDITQDPGLSNANSSGSGSGGSNATNGSGSSGSGSNSTDGSGSGASTSASDASGAASTAEPSSTGDESSCDGSDTDSNGSDGTGSDNSGPGDAGSAGSGSNSTDSTGSGADGSTSSDGSSGSSSVSAATSSSSPSSSSSSFPLQNGQTAQQLNAQFKSLTANSSCTTGEAACIGSNFALCNNGVFEITDCGSAAGNTCAALPLVNEEGTTVTCVSENEAKQRIAATGATGGLTGSD